MPDRYRRANSATTVFHATRRIGSVGTRQSGARAIEAFPSRTLSRRYASSPSWRRRSRTRERTRRALVVVHSLALELCIREATRVSFRRGSRVPHVVLRLPIALGRLPPR